MSRYAHNILICLLKACGKSYTPDPLLPVSFVLKIAIRRLIWLLRGWIKFHKSVFVGRQVTIDGRHNIDIGSHATLDPDVWINAIAHEKVTIGQSVRIGAYSRIMCTAHLSKVGRGFSIGAQSGCGEYCFFGAAGGICIGQNVMIGQYVSMHAQDHVYDDLTRPIQQQGTREQGISIGDDCWIGAKATLLDGTVIGNHSIVAAGAVVKGIFPDNAIIGGVPAKILKMRHD